MPPGSTGDHQNLSAKAGSVNLQGQPSLRSMLRVNIILLLPLRRLMQTRTLAHTLCSTPDMQPHQGPQWIHMLDMPSPEGSSQPMQLLKPMRDTHTQPPGNQPTRQIRLHLPMDMQHQGILVTLTINIWYIAKPA